MLAETASHDAAKVRTIISLRIWVWGSLGFLGVNRRLTLWSLRRIPPKLAKCVKKLPIQKVLVLDFL